MEVWVPFSIYGRFGFPSHTPTETLLYFLYDLLNSVEQGNITIPRSLVCFRYEDSHNLLCILLQTGVNIYLNECLLSIKLHNRPRGPTLIDFGPVTTGCRLLRYSDLKKLIRHASSQVSEHLYLYNSPRDIYVQRIGGGCGLILIVLSSLL